MKYSFSEFMAKFLPKKCEPPQIGDTWEEREKPSNPWSEPDRVVILDVKNGWIQGLHNRRTMECPIDDLTRFYERVNP